MEAKELRIGNWVYTGELVVKSYSPSGLCNLMRNIEDKDSDIKPIPLTEEWLLKFGFKHFADGQYAKMFENLDFNWDKECGLYIFLRTQEDNVEASHIKHVHQLQNLYFALTNEEL
jgi:hypothetical protein